MLLMCVVTVCSDAEPIADALVSAALRQPPQHFSLARRERLAHRCCLEYQALRSHLILPSTGKHALSVPHAYVIDLIG